MRSRLRALGIIAVVLVAMGLCNSNPVSSLTGEITGAQAQSPPAQPGQQKPEPPDQEPAKDETPVKLGTDLVVLEVTVVDPANKPVTDLAKENFTVVENKDAQKIEFFSREQVPMSLAFVIDTSGSMRYKLDTVIKAATNIVKETRPGDEMAVIEFKEQPELLEEFTGDARDVVYTLEGLVASHQTAMLDSLYLAAKYTNEEGKNHRKAVLVVTDGLDNDSYYKTGQVIDYLKEMHVQVYLIGFTSDLDDNGGIFHSSSKSKAEHLLTRLADDTGGHAFFPKQVSETTTIAQQISTDLRTQYSIGYYPTNSKKDGSFRAVRVDVNGGSRKLVARTRSGYTAPRDAAHMKP